MSTDTQAAIDAGIGLGRPAELQSGKYYVLLTPPGRVEHIDLTTDDHRDFPRRIRATPTFTDSESLCHYWDRHHTHTSAIYANPDGYTITAVLDEHAGAIRSDTTIPADVLTVNRDHPSATSEELRPAWRDHRATLRLNISRQLDAWRKHNTKEMSQADFAAHIEDQLGSIADPPAADLMEMAQHFHATTNAEFTAAYRLDGLGNRILSYAENTDATTRNHAGQPVTAPTRITLIVPIWRGEDTTTLITATIRYRVRDHGKLVISYHLQGVDDMLDAAFTAIMVDLQNHTGTPVLRGHM